MADETTLPLKQRLETLLDDPQTLDKICAHLANGGDLIYLCRYWGVPFGDVSNWLHKDPIRHKRWLAAVNDRVEYSQEAVLREMRSIGFADVRQLWNADGSMKLPSEWPEELAKAVSTVEMVELFEGRGEERQQVGWTKRVRFWDKGRALETLMKNLGLLTEKVEHSGELTVSELVMESLRGSKDDKKDEALKQITDAIAATTPSSGTTH